MVGVPDILQVEEARLKPCGSDGVAVHELTAPPDLEGVRSVICVFRIRDTKLLLYDRDEGFATVQSTKIVMAVEAFPAGFVAVIVYDLEGE